MTPDLVVKRLDELAELRETEAELQQRFQTRRDRLLKPLRVKLDQLATEESEALASVRGQIAEAERQVRDGALAVGESVKGERLQAVFVRGSSRWDTSFLEGLATEIPAILKAKTTTAPTVQIREVRRPATAAA